MQNKTNWLAIIAAAVAGSALGFLFYGALFQDVWMAGNGLTANADQTVMIKNGVEYPVTPLPMIINTVAMLIYAVFMNWLINKTNETTLMGGLKMGAAIGGIVFLGIYVANRFSITDTTLSMVDGSYALALFATMGIIIGAWRRGGQVATA